MSDTTEDGFLGGRLSIRQPRTGYRAGIDPVILAAAVSASQGQSVLELGTGVGTALLCLGARVADLDLTGVELQPDLAALASENLSRNGFAGTVVVADLSALPVELRTRSFDHVIANPPYFQRDRGTKSAVSGKETGRGESVPLSAWIDVATRRLAPGGTLTLIQRASRLSDVLTAIDERLGSLKLKPIAPRSGRDAELIVLSAKKGGRADMRIASPFVLHEGHHHDGDRDSYTAAAKAILRDGAPFPL